MIKALISFRYLTVYWLCLGIFGCAIVPDAEQPLPIQTVAEREAALTAFNPWRASGSIALESKREGKFNASFSWDAIQKNFEIKLFGPLGVQAFQLTQAIDKAELTDRNGDVATGDAEELLLAATGFPIPINQMQVWAVGLPGVAKEVQRDDQNRLESIVVEEGEFAWNIEYTRYAVANGMYLPKVVLIDGDGIKIKLSFKKWQRLDQIDKDPEKNGNQGGRLRIPGT